jgi:hypothetical protein
LSPTVTARPSRINDWTFVSSSTPSVSAYSTRVAGAERPLSLSA